MPSFCPVSRTTAKFIKFVFNRRGLVGSAAEFTLAFAAASASDLFRKRGRNFLDRIPQTIMWHTSVRQTYLCRFTARNLFAEHQYFFCLEAAHPSRETNGSARARDNTILISARPNLDSLEQTTKSQASDICAAAGGPPVNSCNRAFSVSLFSQKIYPTPVVGLHLDTGEFLDFRYIRA